MATKAFVRTSKLRFTRGWWAPSLLLTVGLLVLLVKFAPLLLSGLTLAAIALAFAAAGVPVLVMSLLFGITRDTGDVHLDASGLRWNGKLILA